MFLYMQCFSYIQYICLKKVNGYLCTIVSHDSCPIVQGQLSLHELSNLWRRLPTSIHWHLHTYPGSCIDPPQIFSTHSIALYSDTGGSLPVAAAVFPVIILHHSSIPGIAPL